MLAKQIQYLALAAIINLGAHVAFGQCSSTCAPDAKQPSGAISRICMPQPSCYNGNLVIYAHGYVDAFKPVQIPEEQLTLPDGVSVPQLINSLGFAFATTSYRRNGLAVLEGVQDVRELVDVFRAKAGSPQRIFVVGPSEGGLVAAKSVETYPNVYAGGVAACGPIGNFRSQINYVGDFRVIFDYLFPGLLPGDVTQVPQSVIDNWSTVYEPRIRRAVREKPDTAAELLRVANIPIINSGDTEDAILRVAWYAVFAVNDTRQQLRGQPFDNIGKWYVGSQNDLLLNIKVQRLAADSRAVVELQKYETSGLLAVPLVTIHTIGDPVIPYWHEWLFRKKVEASRSTDPHTNIPVWRYGHCAFNANEVLFSFGLLLLHTAGRPIPQLPSPQVMPLPVQ